MDFMEKIISNINNFMEINFNTRKENQIELEFIRLNGLSNTIYLVKVFDKTSKTLVKELIYRSFGEISEFVDREAEMEIINNLSEKNVTPKIFETDNETYRIEEYIQNSDTLPRQFLNEEFILEKIINLLVTYSLISCIYNFTISSDHLSKEYKISFDPKMHHTKRQNMFDKCMNMMFSKAKRNFEKFKHKLSKKYDNFINEEVMTKIDKIKHYMGNYKALFAKVFPKNGLATICHNDVHSLNLLLTEDTEKVIILDHEYACFNLIGNDIVNYLIETKFNYTLKTFPFFEFDNTNFEINFSKFYAIFLQFMQKFELANNINSFSNSNFPHSNHESEKIYKLFQKAKKETYFYKVVCVISLFWFGYSIMYLDYDGYMEKSSFDQIQHALDRMFIFEKAYFTLNELKMKKKPKVIESCIQPATEII